MQVPGAVTSSSDTHHLTLTEHLARATYILSASQCLVLTADESRFTEEEKKAQKLGSLSSRGAQLVRGEAVILTLPQHCAALRPMTPNVFLLVYVLLSPCNLIKSMN